MNSATNRHFFLYEPGNEYEVCLLFGVLLPYLNGDWVLDEYTDAYPDSTFLVNGKSTRVEFELYSANFADHGHDPENCDMIVCWKHNWPKCPVRLEVVELSQVMEARGLRSWIKNSSTKYPVRQWTVAEFLHHVQQYHGAVDVALVREFLQRLDGDGQVLYMPGRGRREATLKIYVKDLSETQPPLGIHSTPERLWAWVDYQPLGAPRDDVVPRLRDLLGEPLKKWHNIAAPTTVELIQTIQTALEIMKGG